MPGKLLGYIRVSAEDQNPERQLPGQLVDKLFIDKASGKNISRPQLEILLNYAREGDTIIVHSMDRLARNLDDLRQLVFDLTKKNITIQFVKENISFSGDNSPMATLLLSVMGAFAEFERALIRERQKEGTDIAKRKGAFKGRKRLYTKGKEEDLKILQEKFKNTSNKSALARELGISRESLYHYARENI